MGHPTRLVQKTGVAACTKETEFIWHIATVRLFIQLADGDTIKAIKRIRGSLATAFELTKVIKCSMFLKS